MIGVTMSFEIGSSPKAKYCDCDILTTRFMHDLRLTMAYDQRRKNMMPRLRMPPIREICHE